LRRAKSNGGRPGAYVQRRYPRTAKGAVCEARSWHSGAGDCLGGPTRTSWAEIRSGVRRRRARAVCSTALSACGWTARRRRQAGAAARARIACREIRATSASHYDDYDDAERAIASTGHGVTKAAGGQRPRCCSSGGTWCKIRVPM